MKKYKKLNLAVGFCVLLLTLSVKVSSQISMDKIVDDALAFSLQQSMGMYETLKVQPDRLPRTVENGKFITSKPSGWVSGFFPGTLWYLYENSKDTSVLRAAEAMTNRIEKQQYDTTNHDVGFKINCSFGNGYRLTGKETYRQVIINGAKSLSTRFNPTVGCTQSWNREQWSFPVIIDNMMNLELLTVASSYMGESTYYNMAKSHADKTMENHFRTDGSSYHVVNYDDKSGEVLTKITHQGLSDDSSWARGQAWGLYGFTMMYRQTGKQDYLDQAIKIAQFIMNHPRLPKDKIPYWDFDAPNIPKAKRDASAGAIMASAFIELSTMVQEKLAKDFFRLGEQQIRSLASTAYRAKKVGDNHYFILQHSVGFMSKYEVDAPLSYADYYFVEALVRYKKLKAGKAVTDNITLFSENEDRAKWLSALDRIAKPLLTNMSKGELRKNML